MISDFARCFEFVMKWEGGAAVTKDQHDPGGTTKYGIAQRYHPGIDVESLTEDDAKAIYRAGYWNAVDGDALPWPLCLVAFDAAVNQGPGFARDMLRQSMVPGTCMQIRLGRYQRSKGWGRYGRGWVNRLNDCAAVGGVIWSAPVPPKVKT